MRRGGVGQTNQRHVHSLTDADRNPENQNPNSKDLQRLLVTFVSALQLIRRQLPPAAVIHVYFTVAVEPLQRRNQSVPARLRAEVTAAWPRGGWGGLLFTCQLNHTVASLFPSLPSPLLSR